jgi:CheY-like chemotaxis protein
VVHIQALGNIFCYKKRPLFVVVSNKKTLARKRWADRMALQILVVEDHGDTRRVLTHLLGHFGHLVSAADTVKSALAFIQAKRFDAIVSDLGLPDGDGCDVIRKAKRQQAVIGVALTARGDEEDIERGRQAGFDHHLTKPVDFAELRIVLDQIVSASEGAVVQRA